MTVSEMLVVAVRLPELPVTVTVAVPTVAVLLTASVSKLDPVVGLGTNAAVTPPGRPEAARFTLPENPFTPVTVIVEVPEPLRTMLRDAGEAASVKLGTTITVTVPGT
jgi:hypothetical protein